jgi:hypothetical protein
VTFHVPERYRADIPGLPRGGPSEGVFILPNGVRCIACDGGGWEHVSVSLPARAATWAEMCHVKAIFWDPEDVVMQLHPAESQYVNLHPFVLHLWRPTTATIPLPPLIYV